MKKYKITVDGTIYEVEVEELASSVPAPAFSASRHNIDPAPHNPSTNTVAVSPADAAPAPTQEGRTITAPMPGTVLSVAVSAGQSVTAGAVLLILEAMKMENEILAPADGVITSVPAIKGAAVNAGDPLVVMT